MAKKDFFVSYNKSDKAWAKWIAGTLVENGYSVNVQAWDIVPGDDFIERMNDFLENSKNYIPVLSVAFLKSEYCNKELQTAFNAHLKGDIIKFIPIRVEDITLGKLYSTTVYTDLFDVDETTAESELLRSVGYTVNPRKKGTFPGGFNGELCGNNKAAAKKPKFPGIEPSASEHNGSQFTVPTKIRDILILEKDRDKKINLFVRMACDAFHALGFDDSHFSSSAHALMREFDAALRHRTENRIALVEIKSQKTKVGNADINKYVGVLDVERSKYEQGGNDVVGYFVSRSGFTEAALSQEHERSIAGKRRGDKPALVLLGPKEITRELIQGNVLCSLESASVAATRVQNQAMQLCES